MIDSRKRILSHSYFYSRVFYSGLHRVRAPYSLWNKLNNICNVLCEICNHSLKKCCKPHLYIEYEKFEMWANARYTNLPCLSSKSRCSVWWCFWCALHTLSVLTSSFNKQAGITRSGFVIRYENHTPKSELSCSP